MPKRVVQLSDSQVRNAKPKEADYKLADGGGLYLLVTTGGGKLWRLKYRFDGKEKLLSFGAYPEITLAKARERREESRRMVAEGVDPSVAKKAAKAEKQADDLRAALTFETVAREWLGKQTGVWAHSHLYDNTCKLEKNVFPEIGHKPISEVGIAETRDCLRKIEARGIYETAKRCKIIMGQVFRYAAASGWRTDDPTALLKGFLTSVKSKAHPAITNPRELAGLLRSIDCYNGSPVVKAAMILGSMFFLRSGEMRWGTWDEIDFETAQWNIAGPRMKNKNDHIVPLSRQAIDALKSLQAITGASKYIFPNGRSPNKPLSENGVNAALAYMGYKGRHCHHGWRATIRTIGDEVLKFRVDFIEHQSGRAVIDPNGRAYNRTTFLADRKEMMQTWADYLDGLKESVMPNSSEGIRSDSSKEG